ncbi:MAG: hypothetical protein IKT35_04420, partial [Clostridia bacterium]|nr:hypothetical protein [Clostridia bacterium]
MDESNLNFNNQNEDILADIPKVEENVNPIPDQFFYTPTVTPPPVANKETYPVEQVNSFQVEKEISFTHADGSLTDTTEKGITAKLKRPVVEGPSPAFPPQPIQYYTPTPAKDPNVGGSKKGLKIFCIVLAVVILCIGSMSVGFFSATLIKNGGNSNGDSTNS